VREVCKCRVAGAPRTSPIRRDGGQNDTCHHTGQEAPPFPPCHFLLHAPRMSAAAAAATLPTAATAARFGRGRTPTAATVIRHPRGVTRCQAAAGGEGNSTARVKLFTGTSKEVLFGATSNMLGCLERGDDAAVEAAIEELRNMNPTEAPAQSPLLLGKWRLAWSKHVKSANFFQKAFSELSNKNFQIINANNSLENLVEYGILTVSAKAPIKAGSQVPLRESPPVHLLNLSTLGVYLRRYF